MAAPPELVSVSGRLCVLPTVTLPKLRLAALAVREAGAVAVPETGTVREGLEALLLMERLKLSLPAACGAKTTLKATLWPVAMSLAS